MQFTFIRCGLLAALFSLASVHPALAQSLPTLPPTPAPIKPAPTSGLIPEEVIPVIIQYAEGPEARTRIYRDVMDPVGLLKNQVVTVTLQFPPSKAGELVHFGLYDGGLIGAPDLPGSEIIPISINAQAVPGTGTVRFNFKAGKILGLYRLQVTVGPSQYLLQFYAVQRATGGPLPAITPTPSPEG